MTNWTLFRNGKEVNSTFRGYKESLPWLHFVSNHFECGGSIKDNNVDEFLVEAKSMGYKSEPFCDCLDPIISIAHNSDRSICCVCGQFYINRKD